MTPKNGVSWSPARKQHLLDEYRTGFIDYCRFVAVDAEPGRFESSLEIGDEHRQQDGFIHAGVMTAMADHTAGYSAYTMIPEDHRILTVELKINFLRPAYGQAMACRARVLKPGKKLLVCEAEVFDVRGGEEVLTAKLMATMASVPKAELGLS